MTQVNKTAKIKKLNIVGKILEIKFVRGIKIVVLELENGSKWEGKEERVVILC